MNLCHRCTARHEIVLVVPVEAEVSTLWGHVHYPVFAGPRNCLKQFRGVLGDFDVVFHLDSAEQALVDLAAECPTVDELLDLVVVVEAVERSLVETADETADEVG